MLNLSYVTSDTPPHFAISLDLLSRYFDYTFRSDHLNSDSSYSVLPAQQPPFRVRYDAFSSQFLITKLHYVWSLLH